MKTVGIICEYNPFHLGHAGHIEKTRSVLNGDFAVVCVMSGNFVQRGEPAVFSKHVRAETAVRCGADLVIELPVPYALSSAEGFAAAGVYILDKLGICDHISFGSESGDIKALTEAARVMASDEAGRLTREWLGKGLSYASAQQKAADVILGSRSDILKSPNNLLGIEYIKALIRSGSSLLPITVERTGGDHDGDTGYSASALRRSLAKGDAPWAFMPDAAAALYRDEINAGRGPVSAERYELAVLSRLRMINEFSVLAGISEGLENRLKKYINTEPSVGAILEKTKTKRYAMSRLRRLLMCAVLGVRREAAELPPPYIRVLAMNDKGKKLLGAARKKAELPVIVKPSSAKKLTERAADMFETDAAATDFYVLAFNDPKERSGGKEWSVNPVII